MNSDDLMLEVLDQDLKRLTPGELAEWDQVEAASWNPYDLGDWLAAHGVPFRVKLVGGRHWLAFAPGRRRP